jgi:F0F1-type ATP synthase membrane subunit b/b'
MLRILPIALNLILLSAFALQAAEEGGHAAGMTLTDKWINFGILAAGILYLIAKFALPALSARGKEIEQDLASSRAMVADAEARIASLEAKLKNFDAEIDELRKRSTAERELESKRISEQTTALLAKISAKRDNELASATQVAQTQLRGFAANLALQLAQERLNAANNSELQGQLVNGFIGDLKQVEAR